MSTPTFAWGRWTLATGLVLLLMSAPPVDAGDVDTAKLFLDTAKGRMRQRKYEEALVLLKKAADEDAYLLEVYWLEGQIHEKLKTPSAALAAYRRFLELYDRKARRGHLEKEETKLKSKVEKRVDSLAAGERALAAWEDKYIADLVALAEKHQANAAEVSKRALELVLELRPGHAPAARLYESLGGNPPEDCASETLGKTPFDRWAYSSTTDLLQEKAFRKTKCVEHGDEVMKYVAGPKGALIQTLNPVAVGGEFVYHSSFRMTLAENPGWLSGLVFGITGPGINRFFSVFLQQNRVLLFRSDESTGERVDAAIQKVPEVLPGVWQDLLVHVKGQKIAIYVNGKKVVNYAAPRGWDLRGGIGVFQQNCESEYRACRIGRVE